MRWGIDLHRTHGYERFHLQAVSRLPVLHEGRGEWLILQIVRPCSSLSRLFSARTPLSMAATAESTHKVGVTNNCLSSNPRRETDG